MKLDRNPLSERWKAQVDESFKALRRDEDVNRLYKKLFEFYYVKKYHAPSMFLPLEGQVVFDPGTSKLSPRQRDPLYEEWSQVRSYLGEALRRSFERLSGQVVVRDAPGSGDGRRSQPSRFHLRR